MFKNIKKYIKLSKNSLDEECIKRAIIEMLFFDSIIGNGDRHPQNWGILVPDQERNIEIAPLYDHGNALSMDILEEKLKSHLEDKNKRKKIIKKGKHHCSWSEESSNKDTDHIKMCELLWKNYKDIRDIMSEFILKFDSLLPDIERFLIGECCKCELPAGFSLSKKRASFIMMLLKERLKCVKNIIEEEANDKDDK